LTKNGTPLPPGWVWTTIEDVTQPIQKVNPRENPGKEFIYLDISSIDNTIQQITSPKSYIGVDAPSRARQLVKASDVLFSTVRTYLKNVSLVPDAYDGQIASTGFSILRANSATTGKYLFYYSQTDSFLNPLNEMQRGTSYPAIRDSDVREQPIPLPPLPEQERIVRRIESLFTRLDVGVAGLKRAQEALKRYRASVLKAACEGRLFGNDDSTQEKLPKDWHLVKLGDISKLITKGSSPNWQGFDYQETGIIFVRSQNIGWGQIETDSVVYLPPEFNQKEKKSVIKADDVLLNIVGASIGRCAKATKAIEGGNLNQAVAIIRLDEQIVDPDFVVDYMLTPDAQHKINLEKVDVARANLSLADIREMKILLPSLIEQRRIVVEVERRLSVVQEVEAAVQANLRRAARLRQAILKRAFEGRLV